VLGWRVWRLTRDLHGELRLRSTTRPEAWMPGEPIEARCGLRRGHRAPTAACTCGVYATSEPEGLPRAGVINPGTVVVGAVAMWGTVVEHARGARARYAYPVRLRLVCGTCLAEGSGAVEATDVMASPEGLGVFCQRHRPSQRMGMTPAGRVQQELLATYGVEVLPLERVAGALRSPVFRRGAAPAPPPVRVAHRVLVGVLRAIGLAVQTVIVLWMCLGFLGFAVAMLAGLLGLFDRTVDVRMSPARPVAAPVESRDGWIAEPPVTTLEPPAVAFLCGRSDGPVVHIVQDCAGPIDLWGFAVEETPSGPERDCAQGWLAYTREPDRWICWHAVPGEAPDVRGWTAADGEWFDEDGG
jgi:hypothetical protein